VRNFAFLEPRSVEEASRMLADHGEGARLLAGGTAMLLLMRQRILNPSHVVHLGCLRDLEGIRYDDRDGLRIGALTRIADIAAHPVLGARYPMIASMAGQVANPQIRNMATIGGNLCHGDPASDPPACFIAAGARVRAVRGAQNRMIDLDGFYTDHYETVLASDEIVAEIVLPPPPPNGVGAYARFLRTPAEHRPLVGVGVVARRGSDGAVCEEVRIAVGAATPVPTRLRRAEDVLQGKRVSLDLLEEAASLGAAEISPLSDFRGSGEYRREMVRVILRRTLEAAFAAPTPR
jgi:aerobic carbon-monoxide dehydrogenase medium subunit